MKSTISLFRNGRVEVGPIGRGLWVDAWCAVEGLHAYSLPRALGYWAKRADRERKTLVFCPNRSAAIRSICHRPAPV